MNKIANICENCRFIYKFKNGSEKYMCSLPEEEKDIVKKKEGRKRYLINPKDKSYMFISTKN